MNHPHPSYPFAFEEREHMKKAVMEMRSSDQLLQRFEEIRKSYNQLRDDAFPHWLEDYEKEMAEWFKFQRGGGK